MRKKKQAKPAPAAPAPVEPRRNRTLIACAVALGTIVGGMLFIGLFVR